MTTTLKTPARLYGIDLLRGLACISVLAFHYLSRGPRAGWMPSLPIAWLEPVARYGYLGVHLFFMLSGYVIFMSAIGRTPREFVASRVSRLYPALWMAATLTMLLTQWHGNPALMVSWRDFAWNLTLVPQYAGARYVDGAYWSLAIELQFYIFVWIVLVARMADRIELFLWAWLFTALVDAIRPMYPVERWLIANWAPLFIVGASTFLASARGWTSSRIGLLACSVVLSFWHALHELGRTGADFGALVPEAGIVLAVIGTSVSIFVVIACGRVRVPKTRWATILGALTYPVYLVHQNAGYALYTALSQAGLAASLALTVTVTAAFATGYAIHRCVEQPLSPRLRALMVTRRVPN